MNPPPVDEATGDKAMVYGVEEGNYSDEELLNQAIDDYTGKKDEASASQTGGQSSAAPATSHANEEITDSMMHDAALNNDNAASGDKAASSNETTAVAAND